MSSSRGAVLAVAFFLASTLVFISGCSEHHGCLGGDDGVCQPPTACPDSKSFACAEGGGTVRIGVLQPGDWTEARPKGQKALGAAGDFVLENDRVRLVIDAPTHMQGLAPTGGSIIDFSVAGADGADQMNGIYQGVGLLPRDAASYDKAEIIDSSPAFVALIVRGHLDGDARVSVVTRYELRPCEPGVRIRTEVYNGSPEMNTFWLTDGYFWGAGGVRPFAPLQGEGFAHPDLDLLNIGAAWRKWPFTAARVDSPPFVSYASVPCGTPADEGFNDPNLAAAGTALAPTVAYDGVYFERFLLASTGPGLAPAVGEALRARADFQNESLPALVRGRVVAGDPPAALDGRQGLAASLLFFAPASGSDPDDVAGRTPYSEAVSDANGLFEVELPPDRPWRVLPHAFGRVAGASVAFQSGASGSVSDLGDVPMEKPAHVVIHVEESTGEPADFAQVIFAQADAPASGSVAPSVYGVAVPCDPMLGPPFGPSPSCNRALVVAGSVDLLVPQGHYFVYATRGPFASLDRAEVVLAPGDDVQLTLNSRLLPIVPNGVVSADFHVHSGASFDSSLPQIDRIQDLLAAGVDIAAATDHDVVSDYSDALSSLGVTDRLAILPGVEATPEMLWFQVPWDDLPKTLGHFNYWPLNHDRFAPRGGAPWDERREPGQLMDELEASWSAPGHGVRQVNHPWSPANVGRDEGFLRVIHYDPRVPLAAQSFAGDVLLRRPIGGHRNLDFDTLEVMNGASRRQFMRNRLLWFSFLNQGFMKTGTGNSDAHALSDTVGYSRNLVWGGHSVVDLDVAAFADDVIAGRVVGTNGPVLDVTLIDPAVPGNFPPRPSHSVISAGKGASVAVHLSAAPWIPVSEVRFIVNGKVVKTVPVALGDGADPFGPERSVDVTADLGELVQGVPGDAWLVVEAGLPLPLWADLDDDGVPDTLDNNGDGVIDQRDVGTDPDDEDARFPEATRPPQDDPRFHLACVVPGLWPFAFSNPFFLDLDGGGWTAPGLP